jgi:hypothetical protein
MIKKTGVVILIIIVSIQFIRPSKNIHGTADFFKNDISVVYSMPDNVKNILKTSCYDCHSNNTIYPWYSNIQPFGWWLQFHVDEGKLELNFSEFASYPLKKQAKKLHEIVEEIKWDKMPMPSYLWIHKDAKLKPDDKRVLITWLKSFEAFEKRLSTTKSIN